MASQLEISVSNERALTQNLGQLVDDLFEVAQIDAGMLLAAH